MKRGVAICWIKAQTLFLIDGNAVRPNVESYKMSLVLDRKITPGLSLEEQLKAAPSVDESVSTRMKCIICLVAGLIFGAWAVETRDAYVLGPTGLEAVMRCISTGP